MNKPIEINADCQFIKELENGNKLAMYNLTVAKGQLELYNKGIKPSRHWKISDVKRYFGMNGSKEVLLNKLILLSDVVRGVKWLIKKTKSKE